MTHRFDNSNAPGAGRRGARNEGAAEEPIGEGDFDFLVFLAGGRCVCYWRRHLRHNQRCGARGELGGCSKHGGTMARCCWQG